MRLDTTTGTWRGNPAHPACERAALLITRHIDGELKPDDARELRAHLSACTTCRRALDVQSAHSRQLAESLQSLWGGDPRKKKLFASDRNSFLFRAFLTTAASIALIAGIATLGRPASAPSGENNASTNPLALTQSTAMPLPPAAKSSPKAAEVPSVAPVAQENQDTNAPIENGPDDTAPILALETNAEEVAVAPAAKLPDPPKPPPARMDEALAALNAATPLKLIPGISMTVSVIAPSGENEDGQMSLWGRSLNGEFVIRIETRTGDKFEAAQKDLDAALPERYRQAARKLLEECKNPRYQKRIEEALKK